MSLFYYLIKDKIMKKLLLLSLAMVLLFGANTKSEPYFKKIDPIKGSEFLINAGNKKKAATVLAQKVFIETFYGSLKTHHSVEAYLQKYLNPDYKTKELSENEIASLVQSAEKKSGVLYPTFQNDVLEQLLNSELNDCQILYAKKVDCEQFALDYIRYVEKDIALNELVDYLNQ